MVRMPTSSSPLSFTECSPLDVGHLNVRARRASGLFGGGDAARFVPRPGDHDADGPA